jgi:Mn2+/Fe2+ NRAMP family transporter
MTASRSVMGAFVNRPLLTGLAVVISTIVIGMNTYLILATLTGA